jgi:hypothetical protein
MSDDRKIPEKWRTETRAVKAIQLAFDVGERVQYQVRKEALDLDLAPSDRVRQILGLPVTGRPKRPRLSISLSEEDFVALADHYGVSPGDRIAIKRKAAETLIRHFEAQSGAKSR